MRNEKDFLDAIAMMAMEAAKKDAYARRKAEEDARRKREDELAEMEAKRQEEIAAQREAESAILGAASQMLGEVLEALEEAAASEEEMDCEECPHKKTCDTYNENYEEEDDCYEEDDEDYYEEDDLYDVNGCDCDEEPVQPRPHMFRSPFPFLMPGQVPAGVMVSGPIPENEEEARELDRLIRKGYLAEAKENEEPEDAVASIISNYRKLNSKEKAQVLSVLKIFM